LTDSNTLREELKRRVDAIEAGYEFMLAYAAQGLPGDQQATSGGQLREFLGRFDEALTGLAGLYRDLLAIEQPDRQASYADFLQVLERDAAAAQAGLRMVIAQPTIGSQLIDNLNASIHVRALLTDIFLIDELLARAVASRSQIE
jgi:hypothetical protein